MWKKKVKSKKIQFLLIGIMLFVTACVLCTCISFSLELKTYAKRRFSEQYCPDAYIYAMNSVEVREHIPNEQVWSNVKDVHSLNGKSVSIPILHNDTNISSITNMMCVLEDDKIADYMDRVEGDFDSIQPGDDEVWIPKTMASSYGIKIGDHLFINYETPVDLTVTCIYTATFAPSERLTIMANIVNEVTLQKFQAEPDAGILAVNLVNQSEDSFAELAMQDEYSLITFDRTSLSDYVTKISSIVGLVSAAAAFIVFLAALFIIRFIIQNDLRKELRSIGIYKSLGYGQKSIVGIYLKAYLAVGSGSILLGSISSLPLVKNLAQLISSALGRFSLSITSGFVAIGASLLLIFLLLVSAWIVLKKVKRVSPVEAITVGQKLGEQRLKKSIIPFAKSPFTTQINEIFQHKKTSIVTFLVLTVSMYLILFFAASYSACTNVYNHANIWLACPRFNCIVTGEVNDKVMQAIADNEYVEHVISGDCFYYPAVTVQGYDGNSRNISFYVFSDANQEVTGVHMAEGNAPKRSDEIALTSVLLSQLGKTPGDYITLQMGEQNQQFLICGSFKSMESYTILLTLDAMKTLNSDYRPRNSFVQLKEEEDFTEFKARLEQQFSGISVDCEWTALKSAVDAIETMLTSVMGVMLIVFVIFVLIAIINVLVLTMGSKRRQYGILKSLGFTTGYMIRQNLWHITILMGASGVISLILHFTVSRSLFSMIVIDAMTYTATLPYLCLAGCIALILVVTVIFSLPIKKITPVSLMEE